MNSLGNIASAGHDASPSFPDNIALGRQALIAWRATESNDWFGDNTAFVQLVGRYTAQEPAVRQRLTAFGQAMAAAEPEVHRYSHDPHTPVLERFDRLGRRHERVRFDPAYHRVGAAVYGSGVMALTGQRGRAVEQAALVILAGHHGEGGHLCPLACTAGLIKAIQQVGHPALQRALLPGLTDANYGTRLHGAQFLTEVQGGSDVGANATAANLVQAEQPDLPALWAITGEKWFCSVVDAPLYLLTARPSPAAAGTRGLGLFVVPHDLPPRDRVQAAALSHAGFEVPNAVNQFAIRRLKSKLGTRAMASGEVDWQGALAWQLGPIDRGFHNVVEVVLNTSRLFNAMACVGGMWRAYREAAGFARHRQAFGHTIAAYPAVDQALAQLYAEALAATASTLDLAALGDEGAQPEALRLGVNMNKYWTSVRCTQMVRAAMEVLAGNAAIEDFTPLGRLYRDCMVTEAWEGTHNVLAAQTWRDMVKLGLHGPWLQWVLRRCAALTGTMAETLRLRLGALQSAAQGLVAHSDPGLAVLPTRAWMENAMVTYQAVVLAEQCAGSALPLAVVDHFLALHPLRTAVTERGWWPDRVALQ